MAPCAQHYRCTAPLQAVYWISYLTYLGVAWYALGIGYLFGALLGPLQVTEG